MVSDHLPQSKLTMGATMTDESTQRAKAEFNNYLTGVGAPGSLKVIEIPHLDVRQIRIDLGLSQSEFASNFCLNLNSVRNWEQGTRTPDGAARAYLIAIKHVPDAILSALQSEMRAAVSKTIEPHFVSSAHSAGNIALYSDSARKGDATPDAKPSCQPRRDGFYEGKLVLPDRELSPGAAAASIQTRKAEEPIAFAEFEFGTAQFLSDRSGDIFIAGLLPYVFDTLKVGEIECSLAEPHNGRQLCVDIGRSEFGAQVTKGRQRVYVR